MNRLAAISLFAALVVGWTLTDKAAALELGSPVVSRALSGDSAAVAELREEGKPALDALLVLRGSMTDAEQAARLDAVIDRVGGARYCSTSRLFWHTDLEQAKAEAKETGKPILSLRMMGNLTDEFSCANSRFFRTTLYANEEISNFLRENYVLHWKSVRPVPKVTIDFGDGRRLERTLTGNSIHYVLDEEGRPIDGLPGLYGPQRFLTWLQQASSVASWVKNGEPGAAETSREDRLKLYHEALLNSLLTRWKDDLDRIEASDARAKLESQVTKSEGLQRSGPPPAEEATVRAVTKAAVELPIIRDVAMATKEFEERTDEETWEKIAALHAEEAKLDGASRELIRSENPLAAEAARLTISKRLVEDPLIRLVANFESSIALDTVKNEYQLHRRIHQWFTSAGEEIPTDVERLNDRVYTELFLTPNSDPWIGLVPAATYTGLENGGVVAGGGE